MTLEQAPELIWLNVNSMKARAATDGQTVNLSKEATYIRADIVDQMVRNAKSRNFSSDDDLTAEDIWFHGE